MKLFFILKVGAIHDFLGSLRGLEGRAQREGASVDSSVKPTRWRCMLVSWREATEPAKGKHKPKSPPYLLSMPNSCQ